MNQDPITARQPIKAVFVAVKLLYCLLLRLPILSLYFLPTSNRQDTTWTWAQAIGTSTAKFLFNLGASARFARVFPVDKAPKDPKKVFIPALPQDKLTGVLLDAQVKPADLMGEWYPEPFEPKKDIERETKVIVFMFGGAYVMGDNNPANYATTLKTLCPRLNAKFLLVAYRLAGSAGGQPFPSQLQDLCSAYVHLLNIGIVPKNIILSGESAGGNAVLAFLRHLSEHNELETLLPSCALLSSPWIDLTPEAHLRLSHPSHKTDFAAAGLVAWGRQAFVPPDRELSDPYISPALSPFRTKVPIWIEAGTGEVVFEDLQRFASEMGEKGSDVEFYAVPHGTHAHMWAAGMVGFDARGSIEAFVEFIKNRRL